MGDDDNKEDVKQGWNGKSNSAGPVMSSDW
jgi:hypothetical protein